MKRLLLSATILLSGCAAMPATSAYLAGQSYPPYIQPEPEYVADTSNGTEYPHSCSPLHTQQQRDECAFHIRDKAIAEEQEREIAQRRSSKAISERECDRVVLALPEYDDWSPASLGGHGTPGHYAYNRFLTPHENACLAYSGRNDSVADGIPGGLPYGATGASNLGGGLWRLYY